MGQTIECKVIELNRSRNNVVLSRRAVLEEQRKEDRERILDRLQPGQVVEGTISNIVDFGAFVDLDGIDGLIHISELSWSHVNHPSEILSIGDTVTVKVLDIDRDRQRISLGLKQTQEDPWQRVVDTYNIGDELEGTVTKVVTFGAFVEILDGVEGLVHISELAQHHVENPREIIQPGDPVRVKILEIDSERRRLSLSIKRVEGQVLPVRPIVPPAEGDEAGARRRARAGALRGRVRQPTGTRAGGRRRCRGAGGCCRGDSKRRAGGRGRPSRGAGGRGRRRSRRPRSPTPRPSREAEVAEPEVAERAAGRRRAGARGRGRRARARPPKPAAAHEHRPPTDDSVPPFVGLTGGIGAGKSTALAALERLGAACLSTDHVVHELYDDPDVRDAVATASAPRSWTMPAAAIDRGALAGRAFATAEDRVAGGAPVAEGGGEDDGVAPGSGARRSAAPGAASSRCRCCSSPGWTAASTRRSPWSPTRRCAPQRASGRGHQALDERTPASSPRRKRRQRATYTVANDGTEDELAGPSCRRSLRHWRSESLDRHGGSSRVSAAAPRRRRCASAGRGAPPPSPRHARDRRGRADRRRGHPGDAARPPGGQRSHACRCATRTSSASRRPRSSSIPRWWRPSSTPRRSSTPGPRRPGRTG